MGKIIRRDRNGKPYFKAPPPPDRALLEQDDGLNRKMKFQENKHIPTGNFGRETGLFERQGQEGGLS